MAENWGVRSRNDAIPVAEKPQQIDAASLVPTKELEAVVQAVDAARGAKSSGGANRVVSTLSVETFKPPQAAIDSVLAG